MKPSHRRSAEVHEGIREVWEDETLALFVNFRRQQGGPVFEIVERRERPDRVIREQNDKSLIGVEITWAVEPDDARLGKAAYLLGNAMLEALLRWCPGGTCELYSGEFPALDPPSIERLAAKLAEDLRSAGGVAELTASLRSGIWRFESSHWCFYPDPTAQSWKFRSNGVVQPQQAQLSPERFLVLLDERLRAKCLKGIGYEWTDPLFLLVRNPYLEYVPSVEAVRAIATALAGSPYSEVWLVNYRQGARELAPPPTTIIRLA